MKIEFILEHFDDEETARNMKLLNPLESMFDHTKNSLPDEFFSTFQTESVLKRGSRIKFTMELLPEKT